MPLKLLTCDVLLLLLLILRQTQRLGLVWIDLEAELPCYVDADLRMATFSSQMSTIIITTQTRALTT